MPGAAPLFLLLMGPPGPAASLRLHAPESQPTHGKTELNSELLPPQEGGHQPEMESVVSSWGLHDRQSQERLLHKHSAHGKENMQRQGISATAPVLSVAPATELVPRGGNGQPS